MFRIKFDPSYDDPRVISFKTMRRMVGIMGMFLPIAAFVWSELFSDCHVLLESISAYYHTNMGDIFVGILCAVSFFLFAYHGYDVSDFVAFKLAAISALGIAFFPTLMNDTSSCINLPLHAGCVTSTLHYISASVFFIDLAIISIFLFTKSKLNARKEDRTKQKIQRNRVYRICGGIIVLCLILIVVVKFLLKNSGVNELNPVFWLETIALFSFGFSWLVKGETLFQDDKKPKPEAVLAV